MINPASLRAFLAFPLSSLARSALPSIASSRPLAESCAAEYQDGIVSRLDVASCSREDAKTPGRLFLFHFDNQRCSPLMPSLARCYAAPATVTYKARSPAAAAVAAGLVEPDSRILIHYKKNMDRPQLTTRIMKRRSENKRVKLARLCALPPCA